MDNHSQHTFNIQGHRPIHTHTNTLLLFQNEPIHCLYICNMVWAMWQCMGYIHLWTIHTSHHHWKGCTIFPRFFLDFVFHFLNLWPVGRYGWNLEKSKLYKFFEHFLFGNLSIFVETFRVFLIFSHLALTEAQKQKLTHTHTHAHTDTCTHTHTHTDTQTHTHAHYLGDVIEALQESAAFYHHQAFIN